MYPELTLTEGSAFGSQPYVVMDLARGSLHSLPNLDLPQVGTAFTQIFHAVGFMHSIGCTHRDLKPDNVLIQSYDPLHILISDFDFVSFNTQLRRFCGTVRYAAPEIVASRNDRNSESDFYNKKVDIWSLGMMLLDYCIMGGLDSLPQPTPGLDLRAVLVWAETIRVYLDGSPTTRQGFENLHELGKRMLSAESTARPDMQTAYGWLRGLI